MAQVPFGQAASIRLKQLLPVGQPIFLQVTDTDRYDRSVGKIFKEGLSINTVMVQEGQAAVYREYLSGCPELRDRLLSEEAQAKSRRLGLWAQASPMMPWEFRKANSHKAVPKKIPQSSSPGFDWGRAQQDIQNGRSSTGVNNSSSSPDTYGGSYSGSSGDCDYSWQKDSAGRSCGGQSAEKRSGGR
ncbi:MAG: thermonuclease family protein [Acaryochloridaceae cyanobacterium RU_4_10]|nr:thermonuclease family protein [Acaryochloridaceae cyanobacterium RU_4_10]